MHATLMPIPMRLALALILAFAAPALAARLAFAGEPRQAGESPNSEYRNGHDFVLGWWLINEASDKSANSDERPSNGDASMTHESALDGRAGSRALTTPAAIPTSSDDQSSFWDTRSTTVMPWFFLHWFRAPDEHSSFDLFRARAGIGQRTGSSEGFNFVGAYVGFLGEYGEVDGRSAKHTGLQIGAQAYALNLFMLPGGAGVYAGYGYSRLDNLTGPHERQDVARMEGGVFAGLFLIEVRAGIAFEFNRDNFIPDIELMVAGPFPFPVRPTFGYRYQHLHGYEQRVTTVGIMVLW